MREPYSSWRNEFIYAVHIYLFGVIEGSNAFLSPGICCRKQGVYVVCALHPIKFV